MDVKVGDICWCSQFLTIVRVLGVLGDYGYQLEDLTPDGLGTMNKNYSQLADP